MGEVKKTSSTVYETTDGRTFLIEDDAKKHQEYLNKPKVYILYDSNDNTVEDVFELEETANLKKDKLNKLRNDSHFFIQEHILIKG